MMFDKPMWKWTMADNSKNYGYVKNSLTVTTRTGGQRFLYVNVPTELFPAMEAFFPLKEMAKLRKDGVEFYLDEDDDQRHWTFGVRSCSDCHNILDLWAYTAKTVPGWMIGVK